MIALSKAGLSLHNGSMLISLILALTLAHAAPLLSAKETYAVNKELKDPAPSPKPLESVYSDMELDFQSFDPNEKSGQPLMENHTSQLMKMKKLPKDPKDKKAEKDGLQEKLELTFERLITSSSVMVPGLKQPHRTKSDLGAFLANKPLVIRGDGKTAKRVDGLEEVRAKALSEVKDPIARSTLLQILSENILLKTGTAMSQSSSCLEALGKKKVGDTWKFSREEQGAKIDYECRFEGWAEAKDKRIAVVHVEAGKQRQIRSQPNGVPGVAETEGSGTVYFEPDTRESLLQMETRILAEPTQEEIHRLQAKGSTVPRNRSVLKIWNHLYPL